MKQTITLCLTALLLLSGTTLFAFDDLEAQVKSNEERINQLERRLDELQYALQSGQQANQQTAQTAQDPVIGNWFCSNGAIESEIYFQQDGRLTQRDPLLGQNRSTQWFRRGKDEIAVDGGRNYRIEFYSQDQFKVEETNTRATWECTRLNE